MLLEMVRRDYAQITAQQLSTQQLSTQQHSNTATNHSIFAMRWLPPLLLLLLLLLLFFVGAQLNSYESYLAISLVISALEAAKDSDIEDLIAAVAEGGAVDNNDQVPNAVLALALTTVDQIEDDEEGIVAAVDYRSMKFYSSRLSVCLRRREVLQQ